MTTRTERKHIFVLCFSSILFFVCSAAQDSAAQDSGTSVEIMSADSLTLMIACASLVVSYLAFRASKNAGEKARTSESLSVLHQVWDKVFDPFCEPEYPNGDDAIDCANALKVTAAYWLHGGVSKAAIYHVFFPRFQDMYRSLDGHYSIFPDHKFSGNKLLEKTEIKKAYLEMYSWGSNLK